MHNVIERWRFELELTALLFGLMLVSPQEVRTECASTDIAHYHDGADHCDHGGSGCTIVSC